MGIIQKQTLKGSIYSYIGVLIGFLNMGILSPRIFSAEQIGLTQVMLSIATILSQVGNLGFIDLSNRIFPWFRDRIAGNRGFLGLGLLVTTAGTIVVTVLLILNIDFVIHSNADKSSLLEDYSNLLPLLLVLTIWFSFFDNYVKILYNAVLGTFLRDLLIRILNLVLIGLFFIKAIDFGTYVMLYVLNQGLPPLVVLIIYMIRRKEFMVGKFWLWVDKPMRKQLISLSFYGVVVGLAGIAISNIDKFMINYYIGLEKAGIYAISFYFATIIMIPGRSLGKIAIPVIADAWKRNDLKMIGDIYTKSCLNQIAIGVLLVSGIIGNLDNIYRILPEAYRGGEWIIILISLSNFVSNATGASLYIIGASEYYRYQTYLMILLLILIVISNAILIPLFGIEGAALASLLCMSLSSAARVYIIYNKTGLWPFRLKDVVTIAAGIVVTLLSFLLPELPLLADIAVRSMIIAIPFLAIVWFLNLSEEIKSVMDTLFNVVRRGR
ncbi:MAG: polysaccharide biosynthesis protein [Bacteroidales bacterium]|nr:polysaccharide biosynthesis protein [Bacteroidales bacterium]